VEISLEGEARRDSAAVKQTLRARATIIIISCPARHSRRPMSESPSHPAVVGEAERERAQQDVPGKGCPHRYGLHSYLAHGPIGSSPRALRARFALATSSAWLHWASWSIVLHSPSVFLMAPVSPSLTPFLQTRVLPSMIS